MGFIVEKLEQVFWNLHLAWTNGMALGNAGRINRPGDDIDVAAGAARIFLVAASTEQTVARLDNVNPAERLSPCRRRFGLHRTPWR